MNVLANDISADGHELSIQSVTHPNFGNAQVVFGRVEYFPEEGFVGLDCEYYQEFLQQHFDLGIMTLNNFVALYLLCQHLNTLFATMQAAATLLP